MKKDRNKKIQDIMKLICISALHPDQIDPMLNQAVQMLMNTEKSDLSQEQVISKVKQKMFNNDFLEKHSQPFDDLFKEDEIKLLISYYESDAVKKMYKTSSETFVPIYTEMQHLINEIIKRPQPADSPLDSIVSITDLNYQNELKGFKGNALLKVYSPFCSPCQALAETFSETSFEFRNKIKFLKLNLSTESNFSKEFQINSVPTLLFIKNGKIVYRHEGLIEKLDLVLKIKEKLL